MTSAADSVMDSRAALRTLEQRVLSSWTQRVQVLKQGVLQYSSQTNSSPIHKPKVLVIVVLGPLGAIDTAAVAYAAVETPLSASSKRRNQSQTKWIQEQLRNFHQNDPVRLTINLSPLNSVE